MPLVFWIFLFSSGGEGRAGRLEVQFDSDYSGGDGASTFFRGQYPCQEKGWILLNFVNPGLLAPQVGLGRRSGQDILEPSLNISSDRKPTVSQAGGRACGRVYGRARNWEVKSRELKNRRDGRRSDAIPTSHTVLVHPESLLPPSPSGSHGRFNT